MEAEYMGILGNWGQLGNGVEEELVAFGLQQAGEQRPELQFHFNSNLPQHRRGRNADKANGAARLWLPAGRLRITEVPLEPNL